MPKNIEDIISPNPKKKSIRDIPIPENRRKNINLIDSIVTPSNKEPQETPRQEVVEEPVLNDVSTAHEQVIQPRPSASPRLEYQEYVRARSGKFVNKKIWFVSIVALGVVIFALLSFFQSSTLAYTPKSANINFNSDVFTATKNSTGELLYSVVKLSGDKGKEVPASGSVEVSQKASGTIVVYNNASSQPQRLVATTRFETSEGKVYRIKDAITVPGKKVVSGTGQPGSIEVVVYADQPGESYNIGLSDFTLPGLKGDPRFETIYARSKTPIAGGFVGKRKQITDENLSKAKSELEAVLREELIVQAKAQVPEDFMLVPTLSLLTFEDLPQTNIAEDKASVNVRANLYGVMFKRSELASHLSSKKATIGEMPVEIPSLDRLTLQFAGTPPADLLKSNQISFQVTGEATVVWQTDEERLRAELAGKNKSAVSGILQGYQGIAKANATLRPFWKKSFPSEPTKISIKKLPIQ